MTNDSAPIHPVILPVPEKDRRLAGRDKVSALSGHARQALALSANLGGLMLGDLKKDDKGAPIPSHGIFWSLAHKSTMVAAVAAPEPVGIDIERIRPYSQGLHRRLASRAEWDLADRCDASLFFRYWTAKEAVLKAVGKGLTGLSNCLIRRIIDEHYLMLTYGETKWTVAHHWIGSHHLAAVTVGTHPIQWHAAD